MPTLTARLALIASLLIVPPVFADNARLANLKLPEGQYLGEVPGVVEAPARNGNPGALYILNRGEHPLLKFGADGRFEREIGAGLFQNPHGLKLDADGNVWTTDTGTHLVLAFAPDGRLLHVYGKKGTGGPGWFERDYNQLFFKEPSDVAFDGDGNLYVADGGNFRIVKFDPEGHVLKVWGEKGTGPGQFNFPHALLVKDGTLYVADRENRRIQLFDLEGGFKGEWRDVGYAYSLAFGPRGDIWMTDARADRLVHLGPEGQVLARFGGPGKAIGQYGFLHGLAPRNAGGWWLSDILNWRVTILPEPETLP